MHVFDALLPVKIVFEMSHATCCMCLMSNFNFWLFPKFSEACCVPVVHFHTLKLFLKLFLRHLACLRNIITT